MGTGIVCGTRKPSRLSGVAAAFGSVILFTGVVFFTPLLGLPFKPAEPVHVLYFVLPGITLVIPGLLLLFSRNGRENIAGLNEKEGCLVVVLGIIAASLAGAVPICGLARTDFTRGFFESVSGWTTTGFTVIDVDTVPEMLLIFRSAMQFAGGIGIAVVMLSAFSIPIGAGLCSCNPAGQSVCVRVQRAMRIVSGHYAVYAGIGIILLYLSGMNLFDSVNHALTAVSTGGFSTHGAGIAYWNSPLVEAALIPLMILGSTNVLLVRNLYTGKFGLSAENGEMKLSAVLWAAGTVLMFFLGVGPLYRSTGEGLRRAVFLSVSAITTTGFSTSNPAGWEGPGIIILLILMFTGGCACSSAGGVKQFRILLLIKSVYWEMKCMLLPRNSVIVRKATACDGVFMVEQKHIIAAGVFVFLYGAVLAIGALVMTSFGAGFGNAVLEACSALGTVGFSAGGISSRTPDAVLWVDIACMFLGRFEFFIILTAAGYLSRLIRRKLY